MDQFIGFTIQSGEYMIPILKVREIITMPVVTALPHLPSYVKGITNLRGSIIPVVNLGILLGNCASECSGNTVIVISTGKVTFGIIVSGITGVIKIDRSAIEPPETFIGNGAGSIEGVAKLSDKLIVLLDTRKLLPVDDLSLLEDAAIDVRESVDGTSVEVSREVETIGGKIVLREIHDAREFFACKGEEESKRQVSERIIGLMDALGSREYEKMESIMEQLMQDSDSSLFKEVGRITRKLHDSLSDFKGAIDNGLQRIAQDEVPNAIDKLEFVIKKTEDAVNGTMSIIERYFDESDQLSRHIESIDGKSESAQYLRTFKEALDQDMTLILTYQQFQDITGQTIKKVITLVNSVEVELLSLISKFGIHSGPAGEETDTQQQSPSEGARVQGEHQAEKISQSDVETLLNDFGF
ncbi:MAG: protein phosphatase CheZ [Nitrospiraceae bacterium]|nr:MAG: protein phosphatase CheZ [Nitrospiraceae bacterium]